MHARNEPLGERERKGAGRGPARPAANARLDRPVGPSRAGLSPDGIVALQRAVGNAAVTRMLQRDEHVHHASCEHSGPAPVQRSTVHSVLRSPGEPFEGPLRQEMETRLKANFSGVRLHTGPTAQRSAAEIGARAYTSGSHVVLGEGGEDKEIIAHELYHVIQQRKGPVAGTPTADGLSMSSPSDKYEQEATRKAAEAMAAPLPAQNAPAERRGADAGRPQQAPGAVQSVQRAPIGEDVQRSKRIMARVLFKPRPDVLYRLDNRGPEEIAQGGFRPWKLDGELTLEQHVRGGPQGQESQWVSTGALGMLEDPRLVYTGGPKHLYRIDPRVVNRKFSDVNDSLDREGVHRHYPQQREYAVDGPIPPQAITGYLHFGTEVLPQLKIEGGEVTLPAGGITGWHAMP